MKIVRDLLANIMMITACLFEIYTLDDLWVHDIFTIPSRVPI